MGGPHAIACELAWRKCAGLRKGDTLPGGTVTESDVKRPVQTDFSSGSVAKRARVKEPESIFVVYAVFSLY